MFRVIGRAFFRAARHCADELSCSNQDLLTVSRVSTSVSILQALKAGNSSHRLAYPRLRLVRSAGSEGSIHLRPQNNHEPAFLQVMKICQLLRLSRQHSECWSFIPNHGFYSDPRFLKLAHINKKLVELSDSDLICEPTFFFSTLTYLATNRSQYPHFHCCICTWKHT